MSRAIKLYARAATPRVIGLTYVYGSLSNYISLKYIGLISILEREFHFCTQKILGWTVPQIIVYIKQKNSISEGWGGGILWLGFCLYVDVVLAWVSKLLESCNFHSHGYGGCRERECVCSCPTATGKRGGCTIDMGAQESR